MTENIAELREAVDGARHEKTAAESDARESFTKWRHEFAAAVGPAMLRQARRYIEVFPTVARSVDAEAMNRLRDAVRVNAARVAEDVSKVTLDELAKFGGSATALRQALLVDVAKAMADALQPTFVWNGWFDDHQDAAMPHAHINDVEEGDALEAVSAALGKLAKADAQHRGLQERLDRAEALDRWDHGEG